MGQQRFKRLWMELEVEVVDEMALRSFDLSIHGDLTGLADRDLNAQTGHALGEVASQAWNAARNDTGVRVLGSSGPHVRPIDETGAYPEMKLPPMPGRRDDGMPTDEASS